MKKSVYQGFGKRIMDLFLAGSGLVVLAPVLVVVGVAVWYSDGRPVFFSHLRVGLGGRPFRLLKFRSMIRDASELGPSYTDPGDPRVTPVGAILRRTSLDELPQLINVLRGDMSLVGPRPDTPAQMGAIPHDVAAQRGAVRPGITGLAQISGRSVLTPDDRLALDLAYVNRVALAQDLGILARTVWQAIRNRDTAW